MIESLENFCKSTTSHYDAGAEILSPKTGKRENKTQKRKKKQKNKT